jgi:hypothetical protein
MKSSCVGWNLKKSKSNAKVARDIFFILLGLSLKYNISNLKIVRERGWLDWLDKLQRGRLLSYFQSGSFGNDFKLMCCQMQMESYCKYSTNYRNHRRKHTHSSEHWHLFGGGMRMHFVFLYFSLKLALESLCRIMLISCPFLII